MVMRVMKEVGEVMVVLDKTLHLVVVQTHVKIAGKKHFLVALVEEEELEEVLAEVLF